MTHRWISSPSWPASPQLITISARLISSSIVRNCCSYEGLSISLIPKRGGIMGRAERLQCFQLSEYSCGSLSVQRWPKVQVTWYPFPSRYPFLRSVAPNTSAISRATLGFSAIQTFIDNKFHFTTRKYGIIL